MAPSQVLVLSLLFLSVICTLYSHGFPDQDDRESSGLEEQLDPAGFCQRNQNPKGLGFIGVKYNLLKGNPEGKFERGGVDPGFEKTRKILKLTTEEGVEVPEQICYEPRDSSATDKSNKIFGGTKRYQEKLNVDVTATAGYSGLFDFSFSMSEKYEKIQKSTSSFETVFRDCTQITNKGEARYQLELVENNGWTLEEGFASDVCRLPVKYRNGDEYEQFIDTWGTHVVIKVILGTKTITRFRSSLKDFMNYASENVGVSVSVSGGYGGATGSVSVDVNKFEESEQTNKEFGEQQLIYNIGGDDLPEPIQTELMGIEETLQPKFWSNLDELTTKPACKRMSKTKLGKFLKNMRKAIKEYPGRKGVKRATDNPMQLTLSWPSGYYSLYSAQRGGSDVCPQESGFQWATGSVTNRNRLIPESANGNLIGIKEAPSGGEFNAGVKFGFCTKIKESSSNYFSPKWPPGKYCILRKSKDPGQGKCPDGFKVASVRWNDESMFPRRAPVTEGTYPDGDYRSENYMDIAYCCRRDGFVDNGINLPIENPFILVRVEGFNCQKVCGAQETPVSIVTLATGKFPGDNPSQINGDPRPAGNANIDHGTAIDLRYCHYRKMDDAKFIKLELVTRAMKARSAERECVTRGGHLVSIHSQAENDRVKEMMGSNSRVWIGLKRRTVQNRPWIWWDGTELDFGEWKPDVTDDQNYVSMKADGSWEAKTNDEKLLFVCKVINNCPLSE